MRKYIVKGVFMGSIITAAVVSSYLVKSELDKINVGLDNINKELDKKVYVKI